MQLIEQKELNRIITAESVMTPKADLTRYIKEKHAEQVKRAKKKNYDFLPIFNHKNKITKVFIIDENKEKEIDRKWLISKDTTIPYLLKVFSNSNQLGFFLLKGRDVIGIVTPADLNKLPAKLYFYNFVSILDSIFVEQIYNHFKNDEPEVILNILEGDYRENLRNQMKNKKKGDVDTHLAYMMLTSHMVELIIRSKELRHEFFEGKANKTARKRLDYFTNFRNSIVHKMEDNKLFGERKDIGLFNNNYEKTINLIEEFTHKFYR